MNLEMILESSLAKKLLLVTKLHPVKDKNLLIFFQKLTTPIEMVLEMTSHLQ